MSVESILNSDLSVRSIAINIGTMAIENLKNRSVVWSIPFWVSVRTKIPLDPNIIPARIGKIRYIFFMVSFQIGICIPGNGIVLTGIFQGNHQVIQQSHFVVGRVNQVCYFILAGCVVASDYF